MEVLVLLLVHVPVFLNGLDPLVLLVRGRQPDIHTCRPVLFKTVGISLKYQPMLFNTFSIGCIYRPVLLILDVSEPYVPTCSFFNTPV